MVIPSSTDPPGLKQVAISTYDAVDTTLASVGGH